MSRPGPGSFLPLLSGTSSGSLHSVPAPCSGLLPEPDMLKTGFPQAVFGPGQSSLLAACPQHPGGCPHVTLLMTRLSEGGG